MLYAIAVALLFASRVREFGDETDNLLGGLLLSRGARLYVDFFSSHMPLPYYVAAVGAWLGATSLEQFRFFSSGLLVLATLSIGATFRRVLPLATLSVWAILTVYAHALQFGEMLTASTVAGYGILVTGLLFFSTPDLRFSVRQMLLLSAAIFVALQSELIAIFPIALAGLAYVAVRLYRDRPQAWRKLLTVAAIVAAPHLLLLLALHLEGQLADFIYYAYTYNQVYYAQFVMNPSVLGMLHDWEAQYRTYLLHSLSPPFGLHAFLVLANFAATVLVWRARGWLWAVAYYLFVALSHVRNEGGYYLCSYFSLALLVAWAIDAVRRRRGRLQAIAALAFVATFVAQIAQTYELGRLPARYAPEVRTIAALTTPDERIFVLPFDPYVYLASERMPASAFTYYLPWHAVDPRIVAQLTSELRSNRPPLIVFRQDELVNGQWLPRDYASSLYDFLLQQGYVPLDVQPELFGDVLVRQDRLAAAREKLTSDLNLQAEARAERENWVPRPPPP